MPKRTRAVGGWGHVAGDARDVMGAGAADLDRDDATDKPHGPDFATVHASDDGGRSGKAPIS